MQNRMYNARNPNQGEHKRVLCCCSAGLLRSPTAAVVLSQEPFNYNTRACGVTQSFALVPLDDVLIHWADEIVVMDKEQMKAVEDVMNPEDDHKPILNLEIPDIYPYRHPELVNLIRTTYSNYLELPRE